MKQIRFKRKGVAMVYQKEEIERLIKKLMKEKKKYGICIITSNEEGVKEVLNQVIEGERQMVYEMNEEGEKYFEGKDESCPYRYLRYNYKGRDFGLQNKMRHEIEFWTQKEDLEHFLILQLPEEPLGYLDLHFGQVEHFDELFMTAYME